MTGGSSQQGLFRGRRVFVTGHTGFKGAWLCAVLDHLGAEVTGFALEPPPGRSLFLEAKLAQRLDHRIGDVRDAKALADALRSARPEIVFHLAAQSLVRRGYEDPSGTWATNVLGTQHLLDAIRLDDSVRACVVVTTDKVYRDPDGRAFTEDAPLGGADPYSASKAACELVVESALSSWARSRGLGLAAARAGNTVGGGDWGADRIVPDCVRAVISGTPVRIRRPDSVRPWSHVLDILSGYGLLAARLLTEPATYSGAWNLAPAAGDEPRVEEVARIVLDGLGRPDLLEILPVPDGPPETHLLRLDASKARSRLSWLPRFDGRAAVAEAASFYARSLDPSAVPEALSRAIRVALPPTTPAEVPTSP